MNKENPRWAVRERESWKYSLIPWGESPHPRWQLHRNNPVPKPQRNSNCFSIWGTGKLSPLRRGWQHGCLPSSGLGSLSLSILKMTRVILWASSEKWGPLQISKKYLLCLSVSLSYWVPESLSIWQGEVSMSEGGLWNSRPVQLASMYPQTWSGLHILDIFPKHFLSCFPSPQWNWEERRPSVPFWTWN